MNAALTANTYKTQQIMTASPEELTLMLYNGAIRFVAESMLALENKNYEKSHNANLRAQEIVREFMATLDTNYDFSDNWLQLYGYIEHCLLQGNLQKDAVQLEQAKMLLAEMRDIWQQLMQQNRRRHASG